MKVYLLLVNHEQFFFYSDESEVDDSAQTGEALPSTGIRGWLETRWKRFQAAFHEADAGAALRARQAWNWLHSLTHPDEAMLVRFRSSRRIDLYHPASRDSAGVTSIWRNYLSSRFRRHMAFALFNALIAAPTLVFLWPLPGPNIIGYWFAYRMIHHLMIVQGVRRLRRGVTPTSLHAMAALDFPVERGDDGKARHTALAGEARRLDDFVNRPLPTTPPPQRQPSSTTTSDSDTNNALDKL